MRKTEPTLHRACEWLAALVLATLTLPVVLVVAVLSAAAYRCSPLFVHERLGRAGRPFRFVKIRTLPPSMAQYAPKQAIDHVHVPRVMRFLRRTHLDELPQLWLVLTGHLSLVGPRPEMATLHGQIPGLAAAERLSVRPGITGLWQVSVHCDGLISDRVEYDRLYVQHRSVRLDLWILWCTVRKVLLGRRMHLFDVPMWAIVERPFQPRTSAPDIVIDLSSPAAASPARSIALRGG